MLFQNNDASLTLTVTGYEFRDGGIAGTNDNNWLIVKGVYKEDDLLIVDRTSCLLTEELQEMSTGLKILVAGIKPVYESDFSEPFFIFSAECTGENSYLVSVSFALPNTMEDIDTADLEVTMNGKQLQELIAELDRTAEKFPVR